MGQFIPDSVSAYYIDVATRTSLYASSIGASLYISLVAAIEVFFGIFWKSPRDWEFFDKLRFLFFITTLSTSLWLWVYASSLLVGEWFEKFSKIASTLRRYFDFDEEPLRYVSYCIGILIFSAGTAVYVVLSLSSGFRDALFTLSDSAPEHAPLVLDSHSSIPLKPKAPASLTVYFGFDTTVINPTHASELNQLASSILLEGRRCQIMIEGHVSSSRSSEYALGLSERMARSVMDYLISRGIPSNQIISVAYGKEKPAILPAVDSANQLGSESVIEVLAEDGIFARFIPLNNRAEIIVDCNESYVETEMGDR